MRQGLKHVHSPNNPIYCLLAYVDLDASTSDFSKCEWRQTPCNYIIAYSDKQILHWCCIHNCGYLKQSINKIYIRNDREKYQNWLPITRQCISSGFGVLRTLRFPNSWESFEQFLISDIKEAQLNYRAFSLRELQPFDRNRNTNLVAEVKTLKIRKALVNV